MGAISAALATTATESGKVTITFDCDAGANPGDFVYQDTANDEKVLVLTNNTEVGQCIGLIDTKPGATTAKVLVIGPYEGYVGLSRGSPVFLNTSGTASTTRPITGYLHRLGVAVSATKILLIPNNIRTKLV